MNLRDFSVLSEFVRIIESGGDVHLEELEKALCILAKKVLAEENSNE